MNTSASYGGIGRYEHQVKQTDLDDFLRKNPFVKRSTLIDWVRNNRMRILEERTMKPQPWYEHSTARPKQLLRARQHE